MEKRDLREINFVKGDMMRKVGPLSRLQAKKESKDSKQVTPDKLSTIKKLLGVEEINFANPVKKEPDNEFNSEKLAEEIQGVIEKGLSAPHAIASIKGLFARFDKGSIPTRANRSSSNWLTTFRKR